MSEKINANFCAKESPSMCPSQRSCTIEFDGASKGNPGQAGAGAILRSDDGNLVSKLLLWEVVCHYCSGHESWHISLTFFTC